MWVKVSSPSVNVWDREQGDPKKGLVIPTDGTPIEVEATRTIMAAINDKRLVEVKEPPKETKSAGGRGGKTSGDNHSKTTDDNQSGGNSDNSGT